MKPRARQSLLTTEGMSRADVESIFVRARLHARGLETGRSVRALEGKVVANLFFEASTRTRLSFERAAKALGADVLNFTAQTSSVESGRRRTWAADGRQRAQRGEPARGSQRTQMGRLFRRTEIWSRKDRARYEELLRARAPVEKPEVS